MNNILIQNTIRLANIQVSEVKLKSSGSFDKSLTDAVSMELKYVIKFIEKDDNSFIIEFKTVLINEEASFKMKATLLALFKTELPIDEEFINSPFVQMNAPAIALPFLRSFISTISVNAGYNPIIIPSINLTKIK
jgi:preprotein translocase subunit SecB